ncbi:MAG: hypothetical protein RJA99_3206 [Pseudomonadota bacterium]|jgi:hypothetical protein
MADMPKFEPKPKPTLDNISFNWSGARTEVGAKFTVIPERIEVIAASDRHASCPHCAAKRGQLSGRPGAIGCQDVPMCADITFIPNTPEGRALVAAAILTGKKQQ